MWDILYFSACAAVLVRNYRRVTEADQRRRLKWVITGLIAGFLPIPLLSVLVQLANGIGHPLSRQLNRDLSWLTLITLIFMPLGAAYGILRHRVFDIDVVVRRGVRYLLAKNGMRFVLAALVIALIYSIAAQSDRPLRDIALHGSVLFYLLLIATLAFGIVFRYRLMDWVDRRFFREAYSQETILLGLTAKIRTLSSLEDLSSRVGADIDMSLHPEKLYLFYRDPAHGDLELTHSPHGAPGRCVISARSWVVEALESAGEARDMLSLRASNFPLDEQYLFARLRVELLVPMNGSNGRLAGLLLLGAKRSEEPYSDRDRQLLEALGVQMAMLCENIWLKEDVFKGKRIQHEVLSRFEGQQIHLLKECPACGACYDSVEEVCVKDGTSLALSLPIERTIEGKYRLDRLLGRGGMGVVYAGEDLRMHRMVAVKIMLGSMFGNSIALQRFAREAQAAARLRHPNIVTVYDYGELHGQGGAGAYLVMELVQGDSLRAWLEESSARTRTVPRWFPQLTSAIKAAHEQGVVHRDLKPENILISRADSGEQLVKVLDFGLAKIISEGADFTLTAAGLPLGTLGYMSPEQLRGEPIDHRSDIFSLGVILVECLTGERPFRGRTITDLLRSMEQPVTLPDDIPSRGRLLASIARCLERRPTDRFASVSELERSLPEK